MNTHMQYHVWTQGTTEHVLVPRPGPGDLCSFRTLSGMKHAWRDAARMCVSYACMAVRPCGGCVSGYRSDADPLDVYVGAQGERGLLGGEADAELGGGELHRRHLLAEVGQHHVLQQDEHRRHAAHRQEVQARAPLERAEGRGQGSGRQTGSQTDR